MNINPLFLYILALNFLFFNVKSQTPSTLYDLSSQDSSTTSFQPSLAAVIGILSVMFSLTFFLLIYAKFCHKPPTTPVNLNNRLQIQDGLLRSRSRFSGIDKNVIESLPFFKFSSVKGSREGLECAICLSKFEDIEVLRVLPKCKHAFHTNCLDQWLENHSSCPLCRNKLSAYDLLTLTTYSDSLRFLWNNNHQPNSNLREDSNIELYVQREESYRGSSRSRKGIKEEEELLPIQQDSDFTDENNMHVFHKFNHEIMVSDVVSKYRWSNLSSSDLMFLKAEMLLDMTSERFSSIDLNNNEQPTQSRSIGDGVIMDIKQELGRKREFESKFSRIKQKHSILPTETVPKREDSKGISEINSSKILSSNDNRSMSDIVVYSRFHEFNRREPTYFEENKSSVEEERMRRIWLPIVKRTVQWFANRERRSTQAPAPDVRQTSNV